MSDDDLNKASSAEVEPPLETDEGDIVLQSPRGVDVGRSLAWIFEAFHLFRKYPVPWITTGLIHFGLGTLAVLIPFAGGPLSTIITTVIMGGVVLGCAAQEFGDEYSPNYIFLAVGRPRKLIVLALLYTVVSYAIILTVFSSFGLSLNIGGEDPETVRQQMASMPEPFLVTALFLIPLIMIMRFSIVLIVLHNQSVVDALRLSFVGCMRNLLGMFALSLALSVLFLIGSLPLLLGLLVVYPVMLISTYTAYRDIFTHEQVGAK